MLFISIFFLIDPIKKKKYIKVVRIRIHMTLRDG